MTDLLPTTKQLRKVIVHACNRNNVKISKSKTRDRASLGSFPIEVWSKYQLYSERRRLRTIEFHVEYEDPDNLSEVIKETQAWLTLSNKHLAIQREWANRYGGNNKILKIICVIG